MTAHAYLKLRYDLLSFDHVLWFDIDYRGNTIAGVCDADVCV